ncbi:DUF6597 domain-containing transcriptional factor [Micromonospora chersina]|uniref:DUF6597 domain-containing transcriptional factor n=1 Tax=Micromonospora chersina TaxID=47854 RepID=UPI00371FB421
MPAPALRPWVEHYWLIDWALTDPFDQRIVPHPAVNVVFQAQAGEAEHGEIAGVDTGLFTVSLHGTGRVTGVQFRPGGFRPFWGRPMAELTGRRLPLPAGPPPSGAAPAGPFAAGRVCPGTDEQRCYRLQEAIEQAAAGPLDWSRVAADLGYADQAHLVREFTAVTGVSPAAYARSLAAPPEG